jgi:hypothetical protein
MSAHGATHDAGTDPADFHFARLCFIEYQIAHLLLLWFSFAAQEPII